MKTANAHHTTSCYHKDVASLLHFSAPRSTACTIFTHSCNPFRSSPRSSQAEFGGTSSFVTTCKTANPMKLVVGEFGIPYLLDEQDGDSVQVEGEIFEVDTEKVRMDKNEESKR